MVAKLLFRVLLFLLWQSCTTGIPVIDLTHPAPPVRAAHLNAQTRGSPVALAFDVRKAALLIVDMQNYFLESPAAPGLALVGAINVTASAFRAAGAPVVYVNWGIRPDYANWPGHSGMSGSPWHPPAKGSEAGALFPGLSFDAKQDYLVNKQRETGFYHSELDDILRFRGARTLFFGGVNTDQCVFNTMLDASHLGYDSFLVTDLTATGSPQFAFDAAVYNSPYVTTSTNLTSAFLSTQGLQPV